MSGDYVIYGVDYEEKILDGVDGEEVRLALISHAKNKMFTSEQGRFKVVTYQPTQEELMTFYVRAARRETIQMEVFKNDTVGVLKQRISTVLGIPLSALIIVVHGRKLEDNLSAVSAVVKQDQVLHAIDTASLTYDNGKIYLQKTLASSTKSITLNSQQTLKQLFEKAEYETMMHFCCFKLYYLGAFLQPTNQTTLKEALVVEGGEIKLIVSQKKLMVTHIFAEMLVLLVPGTDVPEEPSVAELLQDPQVVMNLREDILRQSDKAKAELAALSDRLTVEDQFDREIECLYRHYIGLLCSYSVIEGELTPFECLCLALGLLEQRHSFNLEVFLMESVLFNRQRKQYFFERLEQLLSEADSPANVVESIFSLVLNCMSNKFNFSRIQRLCGLQVSSLLSEIRTLIDTLYDSPDQEQVATYFNHLINNSYSMEGMSQHLYYSQGFLLIDADSLSRVTNHHDVYVQTAALCYVLALHFPLIWCTTASEMVDLQITLADNLQNLNNQGYLRDIAQLLYREQLGFDDDY